MFCRKCGAALPVGSAFCLKCGMPVIGAPGGTGGNSSGQQAAGGHRFSLLSVRVWFTGKWRMARQEFWIRVLILQGIGYILDYFAMQLPDDTESYSGAPTAFMFAALAVCIVLAVSCHLIYVRRLHDINSSGYVVIPIIIIDLSVLWWISWPPMTAASSASKTSSMPLSWLFWDRSAGQRGRTDSARTRKPDAPGGTYV